MSEGLSKGLVFLLLPFFISYLSKEEFGKLSLYWVTVPLFSVLIDLTMRSFVKYEHIHHPLRVRKLLYSLLLFMPAMGVGYVILVRSLYEVFGLTFIEPVVDGLLVLAGLFFAVTEVFLALNQIRGDYKRYSIAYLMRNGLAYILAVVVILWLGKDYRYFVYIQVGVLFLVSLYLVLREKIRSVSLVYARKKIKEGLRFSGPLIPAAISALLLSFSDRYVIRYFYSDAEVAEYSLAYIVSSIFMAIYMATNKSWQKFILENLKKEKFAYIRKVGHKYIGVILLIGISLFFLIEPLLLLFGTEEYVGGKELVFPIYTGMFFYFLFTYLSNVPFFYRDIRIQAIPAVIAAIFNLVLNIIMVPKYGYEVAAWTTLASYFLEFLVIYLICLFKYHLDLIFGLDKWLVKKNL